jgi:hypothetical protein
MGYTINDSDSRYNGWTNYATWRVNLEMFDGIDPRDWCEIDLKSESAAYDFSQQLKLFADDRISDFGECETLAVDYARAFLEDVNWYEIAEHMLDEIKTGAA